MPAQPWYRDGLRFDCTRCGNCCGGAPGYCWVSDEEIAALATRLGLNEAAFRRRYTREVPGRGTSLSEKANYDCVFFAAGKGCTVYEDRPRQCRTWPFWQSNIARRDDWALAAEGCPGINKGTLHAAADVSRIAADDGLPP
ncbi:MAG: YkgJ family cysteine cluster protein [Planctomycetota bacterium]|nr:MAG: YkgJ family cysteine cluster protein [Planctomycetota bacterium]